MRVNLPANVFVVLVMFFLILVLMVPSTFAEDFANKIELYSNVPDWAKKQYGLSAIGLNVIFGKYKLINGTTLKAGSKMFVLEKWLTFQTGLKIDVGKGGITLKSKFYGDGSKLSINNNGKIVQLSQ